MAAAAGAPSSRRRLLGAAGLGLFLALAAFAPAEPTLPGVAPTPTPSAADEETADPYGRETPYGCFFGFLRAVEKGSYANAAEYLQLPGSLKAQRETVARELQVVLDHRFVSTTLESISRSSRGTIDDGLPPDVERIGEVLAGEGHIDVLLVRVEKPGGPALWYFSWETIREARRLYGELGLSEIEGRLPEFLVKTHVGSLALWQVVAFVLLLPILYGVSWLLITLILVVVGLVRRRKISGDWAISARSPVTLLLTLLLHRVAVFWVGVPILYRIYYNRVLYVLLLVALLWLLLRIVDVVDRFLLRRVMPGGSTGRASLSLGRRALRGAAFLLVIVLALPAFGVNVTATLAGLGIGGLVLAFAAQKSLENVFGGFAMLADKPLTVGDTCRIGGQLGEIEDVTLWATRLRTNERTVVSIPNGAVMAGQIENLTRRDKFWFHPTVGLDYATTPAQMRQVLENIRNLMVADPRVETEGSRARFVRLGASTLDVDVYGYVRAESYAEFLGVQEDLLLRILDIVEQAGTSVAFPTQTVHVRSGALPEEPPKKDRSPA
ncbi:MAG TPA: mechanosensitive ion channel family protein [Thermoanaerobaculia bacterium]|nr:mechanosensitive ion channel family protein [Thermoanaerobaculia bacterium]